jgi:HTH-type transcriptional regulator / antitoxin HigA
MLHTTTLTPTRYEVLKVRPIKTEADYDAALARAAELMDAEEGTREADELDVLATLIEAYEDKHYPMGQSDPIEAIEARMEQQGLTRKDLEPMIGTRTRVAEVLNRKRNLSIGMIRRLHAKLGISAEILIQPTKKPRQHKKAKRASA